MESVADLKAKLRRATVARRNSIPAVVRAAAAESIATRPFPVEFGAGAVISGFMPLRNEIDTEPLMHKLAARGAQLALPVVIGREKPLLMRAWNFGEPLVAGVWGIREPKSDAAVVYPDILLVPLLAFDRTGHRIGHGAGYYDFTLAQLRARKSVVAVGIAFATQEVPTVPTTLRDEQLDLVLTEREVIDLR
jgi:5-formyltetrahydrofolate cyclo-ligase